MNAKRTFRTDVAGLFLFVPLMLDLNLAEAVRTARWPGTKAIPPLQSFLSVLAGELLGQRRISHIDLCLDEGTGLFAGLNVLPKATFATDYSYRTERTMSDRFIKALLAKSSLLEEPRRFNLDFHAVAYRGVEAELEKHWLAKRNQTGTSIMMFVAQHRQSRVLCYATANVIRDDMEATAVRFVDAWKKQTGTYPELLVFDSRKTYEHLAKLEEREVGFITIRKRGPKMLERVANLPPSAWSKASIRQSKGQPTIHYLDEWVQLPGYPKKVRQIVVTGLGREKATFFITNDRPERLTSREVMQEYAQRNWIENGLGEAVKFFHIDSLTSGVRLNVDFDLTLSVTAELLYREPASRVRGFERAGPERLYRKLINTSGVVEVDEAEVRVFLSKRAYNPLIKEAGLHRKTAPVPWMGNSSLVLVLP